MKTVCFIQARMGSTRFPGKVLTKIAGEPLLAHQIRRLTRCTDLDEIVITTTSNPADQPIVDLARQENVGWFCGSEHDVVSRFVDAARQTRAEVIVRVTADCPLIDPDITDRVIRELTGHSTECDYASNVGQTTAWSVVDGEETTVPLQRTFPRGLDAEAFFYDTLLRIDRMGLALIAFGFFMVIAGVAAQPPATPYRLVEEWPQLPMRMNGGEWGETIGVDRDPEGNIWVFHRCFNTLPAGAATCVGRDDDPPILKFSPSGELLDSWGEGR